MTSTSQLFGFSGIEKNNAKEQEDNGNDEENEFSADDLDEAKDFKIDEDKVEPTNSGFSEAIDSKDEETLAIDSQVAKFLNQG